MSFSDYHLLTDSIVPGTEHLYWQASPGELRKAVVEGRIIVTPQIEPLPNLGMGNAVVKLLQESVRQGRFFWLGEWPTDNTAQETRLRQRGHDLYKAGHIDHPFVEDAYVVGFKWTMQIELYLIQRLPDRACLVAKFCAMDLHGKRQLCLINSGHIEYHEPDELRTRFLMLFPNMPEHLQMREANDYYTAVHYTMLLLNTDGVTMTVDRPSDALNKYRKTRKKPPLPAMTIVHASDYVTAVRGNRHYDRENEPRGTHASPLPHVRRGHRRNLGDGRSTWVRDCLVNIRDGNTISPANRSHYEVRPST